MNENILKWLIWGIAVFFLLGFVFVVTVEQFEELNFCESVYGDDSYVGIGNYGTIEEGYTECCRFIYVDHREQKECERFK